MQATLQKILEAIEELKNTLRQEIGKVSTELSHLRADHQELSDRVKTIEEELTSLGTQQRSHETQIAHLSDKVQKLEYRAEDAKGCSRCNNVRIIGLPKGAEGADMVTFLEPCNSLFTLERVHRVPPKHPAPGRPPRPVVAKLLHYRDRDILLQKTREAGPFTVQISRVNMFPEYTAAVQVKRASYLSVKKALQDEDVRYGLLFPPS
ncbi:hypothetical protein NDU88_004081 [Pleurodeles waltl]|uniref:L1 transposable element RRM domain-containing protein n=1 Tax=Pleurodeles waltl TaxID=8319 RepID=A0AAV7KWR4_PLEWA|nr:hypothetical protein NDU88_004081 [Pleurodeles waltl]